MKSIGFKNFRRFQEMNSISLGGINIFVGGNNAGKSTVVKGLLLLLDFLKNQKVSSSNLFEAPKFLFDGPEAHDVNIDTFGRALCRKAQEKEIVFRAEIEDFFVEVCVYNDTPEQLSYAYVKYIQLDDRKTGLKFLFDIVNVKTIVYTSIGEKEALQAVIDNQKGELEELEDEIGKMSKMELSEEDRKKLLDRIAHKTQLEASLKSNRKRLNSSEESRIQVQLQQSLSINYSYIYSFVHGLMDYVMASGNTIKSGTTEKSDISQKDLAWLEQHLSDFNDICNRFEYAVQKTSLEYVYAQNASQQVIYNKKDENDYVSKSLHEFYNQRISSESDLGKKMLSWLKEFCGVEDYKVETVQGVAYRFILKVDGQWVDLADMGRGAIQLVTLCVRMASIIKKYQGKTDAPIVLIEEPEQNLHPALQSKLTDLFFQIYDEYNIMFIIETHSECLVRKSQVVVRKAIKQEKFFLANNPFMVYFFDEEEGPYQMIYRDNGRFSNEFKSSFYNEASKLAFELF